MRAIVAAAVLLLTSCAAEPAKPTAIEQPAINTAAAGVVATVPARATLARQPVLSPHDAQVARNVSAIVRGMTRVQMGLELACEMAADAGLNAADCAD